MTSEEQPAPSTPDELCPAVWDLSACEREPIQIPGNVQPHGVLIAFLDPDLPPVCVSANIEAFTGTAAETALQQTLAARMTAPSFARVTAALAAGDLPASNPLCIDLPTQAGERDFDGILHRHDGLTFLELEPRGPSHARRASSSAASAAPSGACSQRMAWRRPRTSPRGKCGASPVSTG